MLHSTPINKTAEPLILCSQLRKDYNGRTVLNVPELMIPQGQTFGLVGNNGAGKTTLFSLILDLIQPTHGFVQIKNIRVNESENWKPWVSAFIDETFLIGYLTPEEYFYFLGELRGWNKPQVDAFLVQFEELFGGEILGVKKYIRNLSKGNQKKTGIVGAFIGNPEIIILDEPFANLDPTTQIRLKSIIRRLSMDENITFLISSHDLMHTTEVCNRILALRKGEIAMDVETTTETLKELEAFFNS